MKVGKDNAKSRYLGLLPQIGVWIGGAMLFGIVAVIATNVMTRWLLGVSIPGGHEIPKYLFAISTSWAFGWTLIKRGNVRIDVIRSRFTSSTRALFDIVNLLALGSFLCFLGWRAIFVVAESVRSGSISITPLSTPLAIPQSLWAFGFLIAIGVWLILIWRVLLCLTQANWIGVSALVGPSSEASETQK